MTSEGLGEMFEGDSADTCAGKFLLVSMGGRAEGLACADRERGPPSTRAEIPSFFVFLFLRLPLLTCFTYQFELSTLKFGSVLHWRRIELFRKFCSMVGYGFYLKNVCKLYPIPFTKRIRKIAA